MIKIGQKLVSVCLFKLCTRTRKMTSPYENYQWRGQKKTSPNFKIWYRSEFLSNLNNQTCVGTLRSRRIQKNMSFFSCVHFARRMTKTWELIILTSFCAWWVHIKWDLFFWIVRDLSFPTHSRSSKLVKNSLLCACLNFVRETEKWPPPYEIFWE